MRHVAAYLLAVLGGNDKPDAAALKNIIEAGGGTVDEEALKKVLLILSPQITRFVELIITHGYVFRKTRDMTMRLYICSSYAM